MSESDDQIEDSLEKLQERRIEARSSLFDVKEADTAEGFELPGADLSG